MGWTPEPGTASIFATLTINGIIGIVVLVIFELVKGQLEVYYPRRRSKAARTPPVPESGLFGWVKPVWNATDDELLAIAGMDGYVFYRFLLMCFKVFSICAVIGLIILMPIYDTAPKTPGVAGIQRFTMGNILDGGDRLWASWLMTYIYTGIFLYFIYKEYENFVDARRKFLRNGDVDIASQKNFSVMVENVPVEFRTSEKLRAFFEGLFPGEVLFANIAVDVAPLTEVVLLRKAAIASLEQAIAAFEGDPQKTRSELKLKKGEPALCGCLSDETVDAIDYWTKKVAKLDAEVLRLREMAVVAENAPTLTDEEEAAAKEAAKAEKALAKKEKRVLPPKITKADVCGTGFITFKSRRTQLNAAQLPVLSEKHPDVLVVPAPAPNDVFWANISTFPDHIKTVSAYTSVIYKAGLLFYGMILAFIAAVSTLSNLETFLPFIKALDPVSKSIIEGQLPIIMVIVFIALIPVIISLVATYAQKRKSISDIQLEVFNWFFLYTIANVYLMLLAGSIFNALSDAIADPTSIIALLGKSLPTVSNFFINYMITSLFTGVPMLLVRIAPLIIYKIYRLVFGETKLTRRFLVEGPLANFSIDYGTTLPGILYLVCIMLTYWVIAPILLGIGAVLLGALLLVWKQQLIYVVVPNFESGGIFFYGLFKYAMTALMVSTITSICYMAIRQGAAQAPLEIPLIFIVLHVWRKAEDKFYRLSMNLPYSMAVHDDLELTEAQEAELHGKFSADYLRQPEFSEPAAAKPFPYRIDGVPLLTDKALISEIYWNGDATAEIPKTGSSKTSGEDTATGYQKVAVRETEMTTNV